MCTSYTAWQSPLISLYIIQLCPCCYLTRDNLTQCLVHVHPKERIIYQRISTMYAKCTSSWAIWLSLPPFIYSIMSVLFSDNIYFLTPPWLVYVIRIAMTPKTHMYTIHCQLIYIFTINSQGGYMIMHLYPEPHSNCTSYTCK